MGQKSTFKKKINPLNFPKSLLFFVVSQQKSSATQSDFFDTVAGDGNPVAHAFGVSFNGLDVFEGDVEVSPTEISEIPLQGLADILLIVGAEQPCWIGTVADNIIGADLFSTGTDIGERTDCNPAEVGNLSEDADFLAEVFAAAIGGEAEMGEDRNLILQHKFVELLR